MFSGSAAPLPLPLTPSLKHLVPGADSSPSALRPSSAAPGGEPTVRRPWQPPICPPDGAPGQGPNGGRTARPGTGAYLGPRAAAGSAPRLGRRPRGWAQAAERSRRSAHPKETPDRGGRHKDGTARGSGWGGGLLPFSWDRPAGPIPWPAKPHLQTPATPGPARPPSACPAGWSLRVPPRSRRPPDDRVPGVPKAELWAWSRRGLDELLWRVGGPRRCGVKGRVGPRVPPARRSPEALSPAHLPPLSLQGRGRRRAGCTHRHHHPPPGRTLQSFSPRSCPRRPGCQTPGEASGLLCFSGKSCGLRRAQESA